jgi:hypothetical protein
LAEFITANRKQLDARIGIMVVLHTCKAKCGFDLARLAKCGDATGRSRAESGTAIEAPQNPRRLPFSICSKAQTPH